MKVKVEPIPVGEFTDERFVCLLIEMICRWNAMRFDSLSQQQRGFPDFRAPISHRLRPV